MSHPHPELTTPPALPDNGLRVVALGGLGEVGRNMAVLETKGKLLVIDCGVLFPEDHHPGVDLILPDFSYIADRLDDIEAIVLTHGHEDHIGAVPYLLKLKGDIPIIGSHADPRAHRGQAQGAPHPALHLAVKEGAAREARRLRPRVRRRQPLDPRRARRLRPHRGRHGAAHRRLQDGPAAARRPPHRPARLRPARRGGRRPLPHRLDERRRPRLHDARARDRAGHRQGLPPRRAADHRRLLQQPRAPRPAGARRGREGRPQGRHGRALDGAQHGHRRRARLPQGARRHPRRHQEDRQPAATTSSSSSAPAPRASRWRPCRGWPTASTASTSARATRCCSRAASSPATRTPSTASSTA